MKSYRTLAKAPGGRIIDMNIQLYPSFPSSLIAHIPFFENACTRETLLTQLPKLILGRS